MLKKYFKDPYRQIHTVTFGVKWIIIALIIFIVVQVLGMFIMKLIDPSISESVDKYKETYMGHWYCGTFFIEMKAEDHFASLNDYYLADQTPTVSPFFSTFASAITIISVVLIFVLGYIFLRRLNNRKQFEKKTYLIPIILGTTILINNILTEIQTIPEPGILAKYSTSFLSTATYYPQIAYILTIPVFLILLGLILKFYTAGSEKTKNALKTISWITMFIGFGFIVWRFGVRTTEVFKVLTNNESVVRLPFYAFIMNLPRELAKDNESYITLAIFRYFKDLSLFVSASISMIYMQKIITSYAKNKVDSEKNKKRFWIIIISLIIASIWFNLMGLIEINILHNGFLFPYSNAVYSFGIRGRVEPFLYAGMFYALKVIIDACQQEITDIKISN